MSNDLKKQVKVALVLRGKNQTWLAKEVGINAGQLSRLLNGRDETKKHIIKIKSILGISEEV